MMRSNPWLTASLQMVLLLAAVACATPWLGANASALQRLPPLRRWEDVSLGTSSARPVYHGSVVPGGVYSADELRAAMARDPAVADHYRAAAVKALRPVTLPVGRAAYVSYRVNNAIYWTKRRVWIRAGETVLTDGTTMVRARCGNSISERREGPVATLDPPDGELDDFVVPLISEGSMDWLAEESHALGDLLEVPFGPQVFAAATPEWRPIDGDSDGLFGGILPLGGGPGIDVPDSGNPGVPPTSVVPPTGVLPPTSVLPPETFLPPDGGATSGAPETTGGSLFPTIGAEPTVSPSPNRHEIPEPGVLWLVACGVIGLARRSWRRR